MTLGKLLLHPRHLPMWLGVAAALVSGVLLFATPAQLDDLGLDGFAAEHAEGIALVFLGSLAFLALGGVVAFFERAGEVRKIRRRLASLDRVEQAVLREFTLQGRNTIAAPVNDLAVAGLLADGVLAQVGGQLQPTPKGLVAAVRVAPPVRRYLTPEAIGLSAWTPREDERRRLLDSRPTFVGEVARWDAIFQL